MLVVMVKRGDFSMLIKCSEQLFCSLLMNKLFLLLEAFLCEWPSFALAFLTVNVDRYNYKIKEFCFVFAMILVDKFGKCCFLAEEAFKVGL